MDNQRLWQHRSKEEDKEAILSLNLLERANVPKEKTLKCIYAVSNHIEEHYREVFILKNKGGRRKLLVPDYLLHTMQKNILRTILSEEKVSKYAKAYCPGRRVRDNAFAHVGAETILELDIKDFLKILHILWSTSVFFGRILSAGSAYTADPTLLLQGLSSARSADITDDIKSGDVFL